MTPGVMQLFQHITVWSRIPAALTAVDPVAVSELAPNSAAAMNSLNRYIREMRLQEIALLKALEIDPDRLRHHLRRNKSYPDFFLNLQPRPDWMGIHPHLPFTIDDLHQMRRAGIGAKRHLTVWENRLPKTTLKLKVKKPERLDEYLVWLRTSVSARAGLASEALSAGAGDPSAGIAHFFDPDIRESRQLLPMDESIRTYLGSRRTRSGY